MARRANLYDEGFVLFDAMRTLNGDLLHRDFYTPYGPGQYFIIAGLFKFFGASVLVERCWDALVRCASAIFVFTSVDRLS